MRLALVIPSMSAGGAERVMASLANAWAARDWAVTLFTLNGEPSFYPLDDRVRYRPLDVARPSGDGFAAIRNNIGRAMALRRVIRREHFDAVISFMGTTNVLTILATRRLAVPVIVSERIDPARYPIAKSWAALRRSLYPCADLLVVQTERILRYFPPSLQHVGCIIPNPVAVPDEVANGPRIRKAENSRVVIAMGRLEAQKGFDLLLRAFSRIAAKHAEWTLEIWGEGREQAVLQALIAELGLTERARLRGVTRRPFDELLQAGLFVLSSRYEGFPNALCEAMACGLPVISFDCPTGPGEIIRDGLDGLLVPPEDVGALAAGLDRLMSNEAERRRLAAGASGVTQRFSLARIMSLWDGALKRVTRQV